MLLHLLLLLFLSVRTVEIFPDPENVWWPYYYLDHLDQIASSGAVRLTVGSRVTKLTLTHFWYMCSVSSNGSDSEICLYDTLEVGSSPLHCESFAVSCPAEQGWVSRALSSPVTVAVSGGSVWLAAYSSKAGWFFHSTAPASHLALSPSSAVSVQGGITDTFGGFFLLAHQQYTINRWEASGSILALRATVTYPRLVTYAPDPANEHSAAFYDSTTTNRYTQAMRVTLPSNSSSRFYADLKEFYYVCQTHSTEDMIWCIYKNKTSGSKPLFCEVVRQPKCNGNEWVPYHLTAENATIRLTNQNSFYFVLQVPPNSLKYRSDYDGTTFFNEATFDIVNEISASLTFEEGTYVFGTKVDFQLRGMCDSSTCSTDGELLSCDNGFFSDPATCSFGSCVEGKCSLIGLGLYEFIGVVVGGGAGLCLGVSCVLALFCCLCCCVCRKRKKVMGIELK